ncbi:unnamed protein product, partial [Mesocestoides corti]
MFSAFADMDSKIVLLQDAATRLRINSIKATEASNSGHPTSCASIAEVMTVLFLDEMKYFVKDPRHPSNDRFVLSKGQASPVLYAAWVEVGFLSESDLLNFRKIDSDLEGHPTPRLEFVDVATASLGQGLSNAAGMAYTGKNIDKASYRVYCIIGDGESAEGNIWEAMAFASYYELDNLVAIFDVNRLGESQPTALQHDLETYKRRAEAFGWHAIIVDGHNVADIMKAFAAARSIKGKPVATREAYGRALERLGSAHPRVIGLDGDTKNSTFSIYLRNARPQQFIECFIAEQNLVGVAIGCGTRERTIPFVSTFAAFLTRAYDQIRMGAISQTNCNFAGSHVGVSIGMPDIFVNRALSLSHKHPQGVCVWGQQGKNSALALKNWGVSEDGPSQMALEDLAMFRAIRGSTVFYPSDAVSC